VTTETSATTDYLAAHRAEIDAAAARIHGHVRRTPLLATDLAPDLLLKPESFQRTGSFKARGAFNAVLKLAALPSAERPKGVLTVSSGNHAQALALAAREAGLPATILIPHDANPAKIAATRALGAHVITEGITFANREDRLAEVQAETGYAIVHPYDNWDIVHGQATAAREILEDDPDVGLIVTPTGGGGLLCGTALASKPGTKVVGVEPEVADDAARTLRTGTIQMLATSPDTMADGVRTISIGARNFEVMVTNHLVDDVVTVSEAEIANALRLLWRIGKLAAEPTSALPLAAFLAGKLDPHRTPHRPTALVISGGNFNPSVVATLLASP
jgi:threo-3-hydroxy-L-aspartate ammonia-lyase